MPAKPAAAPPEPVEEAPEPVETTVTEFCAHASRTDTRVELLSAFHAEELREGRVKATAAVFADRLAAFAARPV